jgi:hypothetical protein
MKTICVILAEVLLSISARLQRLFKSGTLTVGKSRYGTFSVQFIPSEPLKVQFFAIEEGGGRCGLVLEGKAVVAQENRGFDYTAISSAVDVARVVVDCTELWKPGMDSDDVQVDLFYELSLCVHICAKNAVWADEFTSPTLGENRRFVLGFYTGYYDVDFGIEGFSLLSDLYRIPQEDLETINEAAQMEDFYDYDRISDWVKDGRFWLPWKD